MGVIADVFPPVDAFLELEPEEAAVPLIEYLCRAEKQEKFVHRPRMLRSPELNEYCGKSQIVKVQKAITEAWVWLQREGLIAPHPTGTSTDVEYVTRRGGQFRETGDVKKFKAANMLPRNTLDPTLAARVTSPFLRGEYDSAIFEAFKRVEITVRELSGLGRDCIGKDLMREAFKPKGGPLTDAQQVEAEKEGTAHLFAGAIASFKNPSSHRDVCFDDPVEAVELIGLADLLIRIARRRKQQAGSRQEQ